MVGFTAPKKVRCLVQKILEINPHSGTGIDSPLLSSAPESGRGRAPKGHVAITG